MNKRDIRDEPFWRLAVRFGVVFIVVVVILQLIWELFSSGNLTAVSESFDNGKYLPYTISKVVLGLIYGVTMAFLMKRKVKK